MRQVTAAVRSHRMDITFAYGKATVTVTVPESTHVDQYNPVPTAEPVTADQFRHDFIAAGGEAILSAEQPLVIVNDGYRHTPTAAVLTWLNLLDRSFLDRAEFLIATGTHPAPNRFHLKAILGEHLRRVRYRIDCHDASDPRTLTRIDLDRFGQPVFLNSRLLRHPARLVIGSVEPHYFAGYTGGRKSIFPGLCDRATTERNHNLANSLDAQPLRLEGNPVAEQLEELMGLIPNESFFTVQAVVDAQGRLAALCCGDLREAFLRATEIARLVFAIEVDQPYDTVLCELRPPLDNNLYQAQKALENAQAAVKDGGAAVVLSACPEGVGSPFFFSQANTWNREKNVPGDGVLRFGSHKLSRVNALTRRIGVHLYAQVDPDVARQVFYDPIEDIQAFLTARCRPDSGHRLALVRDAGHTVLATNTSNP